MAEQKQKRLAVVTGGNRGIGFDVCRQLAQNDVTVLLGARDTKKGEQAAKQLTDAGLDVRARTLDVSDDNSVRRLAESVAEEFGSLDILVNNAAINFDMNVQTSTADINRVRETLETNLLGVWRMCAAFLPLLQNSENGARIVNVGSEAGSFTAEGGLHKMAGRLPAYAVSKAALHACTVKLADDLKDTGILVNVVCPGTTATTPEAAKWGARPVSEGAASIVWAAMLPNDGPTGGFFRDGKPLPF